MAPYTYLVAAGILPDGMSLSSVGLLSGTPAAAGTFYFAVMASDSAGCTGNQWYSLIVSAVPPPVVSSMEKRGNPFRITVTGSNFQPGIRLFIGDSASAWPHAVVKNAGLLMIKGGSALKASVPKNVPALFRFVNPDGGETTLTWQWP